MHWGVDVFVLRLIITLVDGWGFTSLQNLRLYQHDHQLVTVHTHGDFIVLPLGNQAAGTMTRYLTQSHYADTELTDPFPILLICIKSKR